MRYICVTAWGRKLYLDEGPLGLRYVSEEEIALVERIDHLSRKIDNVAELDQAIAEAQRQRIALGLWVAGPLEDAARERAASRS